jgi:SAM-dependent methyltransferase
LERHYVDGVDFWRDLFPAGMGRTLSHMSAGQTHQKTFSAGTLVAGYAAHSIVSFPRSLFNEDETEPQAGRFYPKGLAWKPLNTYPDNLIPMRLLEVSDDAIVADTNHPLARFSLTIKAEIMQTRDAGPQRGGAIQDLTELLTGNGPGMQVPLKRNGFYDSGSYPYSRGNEEDDGLFYQAPRMVHHLDETARSHVSSFYGRLIKPGARVLDLMSSWHSHIPASHSSCKISGIGLNEQEMQSNELLHEYKRHDLNKNPVLHYRDQSFDAVICTASIEYLCRPREIMSELVRIIRPGGLFAATVSERWFPGKQIAPWSDLHPFERQGFILNYFLNEPGFDDINTESIRGYLRPPDDKYARQSARSDPLYMVWAKRKP